MTAEDIQDACISLSESYFPSSSEGVRIHVMKWEPSHEGFRPKAIIQIIHGMEEHIGRYDDFARFLARQGFTVVGSSHIGHGKSCPDPEKYSCLPENGAQVMVSDVHTLRVMTQSDYPEGIPYVMFGHSMGSFVLRAYLARYGQGLAAAIIAGTGQQPLAASRTANWLARRIGMERGFDYRSVLVDHLAKNSFIEGIPNARTRMDWLCTDPCVVDDYLGDPACGVMFSVGGYVSLTDLTAEVVRDECAAAVPAGLPVLFIAGSEDPVGDMGVGVELAADAMQRCSEARVTVIIYEGMRHEVLNEPGHELVYSDVLNFILTRLGEK